MAFASEDDLEQWALDELKQLGYTYMHGARLSPDEKEPLRDTCREVLLLDRLQASIEKLNHQLPDDAVRTVMNKIRDAEFSGDLLSENRRVHDLLTRGIRVSWFEAGEQKHDIAKLIDWENEQNDWLVVNQFVVIGEKERRPDAVIFLNGMPIIVIELKGTETGTLKEAFNQLETYKSQVPDLFRTNLFNVISEGVTARYGSISANFDRYMRWRTVDGETVIDDLPVLALQTLIEGLLDQEVILEMIRYCTVFEDEGRGPIKKIAGYHQFHAVRKGVKAVLEARGEDGRGGVMWHTQGSGKSLLMSFLTGRLMRDPRLENPTLVVITDRNDLDNQLFATFSRCAALFGEKPLQATDLMDLRSKLAARKVGGIIFTTIQKFKPAKGEAVFGELTDRTNVVVFADEAHRSQYGFEAKIDPNTGDTKYGHAHHLRTALPNAVYVGFTGTPIDLVGADTRAVFGDYIDVYDISRAASDGATVPIFYEGRVAKMEMSGDFVADLDEEFEDILIDAECAGVDLDEETKGALSSKWTRLERIVGAEPRLDSVVADILEHFDARIEAMDGGKAMIVCMSRRICVEVYERIVTARPQWHADEDSRGNVKVIMTGAASDPAEFQPHIRSKSRLETLRGRYRDPSDDLQLVIVRDMWLTGFDAPCMHTLYVDKPMKGHGLMQAITRINRVFGNKPAGLVVDYIGLAADLKHALEHYSAADQEKTGISHKDALDALRMHLDTMRSMFAGVPYMNAVRGSSRDRIKILPMAIEHALSLKVDGEGSLTPDESKKRFLKASSALVKAYRIASGSPEATIIRDEVGFFLAVQAAIRKMDHSSSAGRSAEEADHAISQLLDRAVVSTEVIDILEAAGIDRPDISILSDDFLQSVKNSPYKSLTAEALRKLLNGEIQARTRTNRSKNDAFSKLLQNAIARYHNRSIDAVQVINEMINLAKDLQKQPVDGMTEDEVAFYDALAESDDARALMGNKELRVVAQELLNAVQKTASVDWWRKQNVRMKMRVTIKRILKRHGFPPNLHEESVKKVLQQAEVLAKSFR